MSWWRRLFRRGAPSNPDPTVYPYVGSGVESEGRQLEDERDETLGEDEPDEDGGDADGGGGGNGGSGNAGA